MRDSEGLTSASERLEFIDSLRGFALFGVFWANLLIFSGIGYMTDQQRASLFTSRLDSIAFFLERFFIENKFMGLFSFLFGISFWLFLSRVRARGGSATSLFYRRIFWLFIIGAAHGWLLWCFDILRFYALWAVLLPLFVRTAPRRLLSIALITSILIPALVAGLRVWISTPSGSATDFDAMALTAFSNGSYRAVLLANWKYDWYLTLSISQISYQVAIFGRLLLGLYAARTLALGNLDSHRTLLRTVLLVGGLVGMLGSTIFAGALFYRQCDQPVAIVCSTVHCRERPTRFDTGLCCGNGTGVSHNTWETFGPTTCSDWSDGSLLVLAPDGLWNLDVLRFRTRPGAHGQGRACIVDDSRLRGIRGSDCVRASLVEMVPIWSCGMVVAKSHVLEASTIQRFIV